VATPALSEIMVRAGVQAGQNWLAIMNKSKCFKVVPFDAKSAIEVAIMAGHTVKGEEAKEATRDTYAKLKYDRQIIAIAHTEGATTFYTDDHRQRNLAERLGMTVRCLSDLPIPAAAAQTEMEFEGPDGKTD
jgi:predicted nucleic acid-binding protein